MKISEHWLREWVNPPLTNEQLCLQLTMAGLEMESITPVAEEFKNIVVGQVLNVKKHPEADRLHLCEVDVGTDKSLSIVCGAANVKATMKVPVALIGAILPNKLVIARNEIRGVMSEGMLCSAKELGLSEASDGLLQFPQNAPIGTPVWDYLNLQDNVIDIAITPNRGDCLSLKGMSREISALTQTTCHIPNIQAVKAQISDQLPIKIETPADCPRYVGRIIRNVTADAITPMWLQERLRRSDIRCISPVVDVMNYVMLELGQPMHAFDLDTLAGGIHVRKANTKENLKLLDGQTVQLVDNTLVIADDKKPLAIAGVMGGLDSGVTLLTQNIFLESAFFRPETIISASRHFKLSSDSSFRFERGIDPALQILAIERATELLLEITGGQPGPIIEVANEDYLPPTRTIELRKTRLEQVLGLSIPDNDIEKIVQRLGFQIKKSNATWQVQVPPFRSDVVQEIDLIEEVIRLHGYTHLPEHQSLAKLYIHPRSENKISLDRVRQVLCDAGYNEVITYSFVDSKLQKLVDPGVDAIKLSNPITADMTVMRTSLWPGLINVLLYNQNRQQSRLRIFETGLRFLPTRDGLLQQPVVSGLINGPVLPEQWAAPKQDADFFDLKGDLQNVFALTHTAEEFHFRKGEHPALHPGQTAFIYRHDVPIGMMGALHPALIQSLDIEGRPILFELALNDLNCAKLPHFAEISKFPEVRRDVAILIDRAVPSQAIQDTIKDVAGELLRDVIVFDVYQGQGIASDRKSIALALTLQHRTRTLRDEEVADLMDRVIVALKDQFAAELRG